LPNLRPKIVPEQLISLYANSSESARIFPQNKYNGFMIFSDRNLAQKLERTEARSNVDFVQARAEMFPSSGAIGE
jgi:hypothetical protein